MNTNKLIIKMNINKLIIKMWRPTVSNLLTRKENSEEDKNEVRISRKDIGINKHNYVMGSSSSP